MRSFSQTNRPIQVDTALGKNIFLATGFRGGEELSCLFSFELDFVAENFEAIDFSKFIGTDVTLKVATPDKGTDQVWRYLSAKHWESSWGKVRASAHKLKSNGQSMKLL